MTNDSEGPSDNLPYGRGTPEPQRPIIVRSEDLLQGRREVWIEHGGEMYRLRLTSLGKLYLTK
jgi:hemin uptake protein HemP